MIARRGGLTAIALALATAAGFPAQVAARPAEVASVRLDTRRIERAVSAMVAQDRTVGASVLVWQGGRERLFFVAGQSDRERGVPFTRDTLVQIFSMTKPVTGVALMQLWEQGRFRLDDPLALYLPQFANARVYLGDDAAGNPLTRPASRPILVRDVVRHTAGFVYGEGPGGLGRLIERVDHLSSDNTLAQLGDKLATIPLIDDPGRQWSYSAAVDVQALLVQTLSGQPFDEYVRDHIFLPLGMTDSAWKRSAADRARLARIYEAKDGELQPMAEAQWLEANFIGKPMVMGGSGIVSTIDDYMRFARMLLGKGSLDGVQVIKPQTLAVMTDDMLDPAITKRSFLPGKGALGFGVDFAVRTAPPQTPEENRGAVGEFFWDGMPSMLFWVDPVNDMAVVFATQKVPFDGTLHRDIRAAVYGRDYLGPPAR
ncbi:CubicO group peptidase (beta-lactamase class C family) [Novosphingobium kunmingense]|uniref:CubicO group peptidase (Beta-lactamase class C family) n=1 Tax=Novosphingobium kunmingense TaxID=1211806 RepID=A0A2N0HK63_9SPHN|nr:serine hydrolase domain-containing protein [Novosphingobium kunmingense]PKB19341.1 CubicO group peptidase (beta-lactamase class C family) [Novosphingobium kunmingense]